MKLCIPRYQCHPIRMKAFCVAALTGLILWCCSNGLYAQEETATSELQAFASPKLEPAFSEDFSMDTRSNCKIKGDLSWEKGYFTLADGVSVTGAISKKSTGAGGFDMRFVLRSNLLPFARGRMLTQG